MEHPSDHCNRLGTLLEGQELVGQTLPFHRGDVLIMKHSGEPLPGHRGKLCRRIVRCHKLPPVLRSQTKLVQREPNSQMLQTRTRIKASLDVRNPSHRSNRILRSIKLWWLRVAELPEQQRIATLRSSSSNSCSLSNRCVFLIESLNQGGLNRPKHLWYLCADHRSQLLVDYLAELLITHSVGLRFVACPNHDVSEIQHKISETRSSMHTFDIPFLLDPWYPKDSYLSCALIRCLQLGMSIGSRYPLLEPEPSRNCRFWNWNCLKRFRFRFLKLWNNLKRFRFQFSFFRNRCPLGTRRNRFIYILVFHINMCVLLRPV
ncbi:uncharacterized protein LOC111883046 [Lactuca sativa]|uniref:uncharacterized protein LOC111883046 n=1 Tax=Lactuca sativa TaxID=4236 RepID=UPI0022B05D68|nr:uncharacterized protein LOC111883046 [Lactuca sativa]